MPSKRITTPQLSALFAFAPALTQVAGRWRLTGAMADHLRGRASHPEVVEIEVPATAVEPLTQDVAHTVLQPAKIVRGPGGSFLEAKIIVRDVTFVLRGAVKVARKKNGGPEWTAVDKLTDFELLSVGKHSLPVAV